MKCWVGDEKARSSRTQIWTPLGKLVATYNLAISLFCTAQSLFRTILDNVVAAPELWFLHSHICCRGLGSFAPNDKHRLEEQWQHLAFTTSTVAPLRMARLGWLASQANLLLHGSWCRTPNTCHWLWSVESSIRKQRLANTTQNLIALGKRVATYNFATSLFCTTQSPFRTNLDDGIW